MSNIKELKEFKSLNTGDILLCVGKPKNILLRSLDWIIKTATYSEYSHVAVVLRDPTFIHPSLKGLYIWESSWEGSKDPQDGQVKLGVQITPFFEFLSNFSGQLYVRRLLEGNKLITDERLNKIHEVVYKKPYDIHVKDWVEAWIQKDDNPQKTNCFWCSALVSYILVGLEFLPDKTDWSIARPCDLSSQTNYLKFCDVCKYSDDEWIY
jgi:hypothetical protein